MAWSDPRVDLRRRASVVVFAVAVLCGFMPAALTGRVGVGVIAVFPRERQLSSREVGAAVLAVAHFAYRMMIDDVAETWS